MDKTKYELLQSIKIEDVNNDLKDCFYSDATNNGDYMQYVVGLAALAVMSKKGNDTPSLTNYLETVIEDETTLKFLVKLASKHVKHLETITKKYDEDTLMAAALFSEPKRFTETDVNSTPDGIAKLAISLMSLTNNDTVLDLGSGSGNFLIHAAQESNSEKLYGIEINTANVIISNIRRLLLELPIKIIQGNIVSQNFSHLNANKVFSNYPLGMRLPDLEKYFTGNPKLKKYFNKARRTVSGDWIFGMGAYLNLSMPGKAVILMSGGGTWNKPDEEFRKVLVDDGLVEGVISLPSKLLASTMIPLTMIVLSQNNSKIKMVDATDIFTEGRRQNSLESNDIQKILDVYHIETSISKEVTIKEVENEEYILNPQRYIGIDPDLTNGIALGDISKSINRGAAIKSSELDELASTEETDYHYLMLQNIQDGQVESSLPSLTKIENKYRKYCINDKNLIISKISPFKVAMVRIQPDELVLANGNLYFIDIDEELMNPIFVEVFLQSEKGIAQLNRLAKGSAMKSISMQDLKTIQIPNIPRAEQDTIAEEYENLNDELLILQKQIDMIRDKKARLIEEVV